jgi:hypothetical protein
MGRIVVVEMLRSGKRGRVGMMGMASRAWWRWMVGWRLLSVIDVEAEEVKANEYMNPPRNLLIFLV